MKIWDIRKKRCIHTYKGHTRRIDVLKFTPDGRWIVSGGADNSVKIWDLTAGKLLHDFKLHEGAINCLDFHPHEFLLATGSADKTVKFWDLESFELIGSSGPENSREYFVPANVVRSMKFNSDGKSLFCGLQEILKVLSWEPLICHDMVDVGWSTLADITVDEGKLLGCSYNQSCVGIWIVDLMRSEPCAVSSVGSDFNGSVNRPIQSDSSISSVFGRLSISRNPASETASDTLLERSMSGSKEIPVPASSGLIERLPKRPGTRDVLLTRSDSAPLLSPRVRLRPYFVDDQKRQPASGVPLPAPRVRSKLEATSDAHASNASAAPMYRSRSNISAYIGKESSVVPVRVPRHNSKVDAAPILSEAATGDLPIIEPRNIVKRGFDVNHGKEDRKLVAKTNSMSSKMDVEVGCKRITDHVECKNVVPEASLEVNLDFDFIRRAPESRKVHEHIFQSKPISAQRNFIRGTSSHEDNNCFESVCTKSVESNDVGSWHGVSGFSKQNPVAARHSGFANMNRCAVPAYSRNRCAVIGSSQLMDSSARHDVEHHRCSSDTPFPPSFCFSFPQNYHESSPNYGSIQYEPALDDSRRHASLAEEQSVSVSDEDAMAILMEKHQEFIHIMESRRTKLEVLDRCWQGNDIKGFLDATWKMLDYAVTADIISAVIENNYCITLDACTSLLHLTCSLLGSTYDRHLSIALEMILGVVKSFGATISSTLSAAPPVGIDLEAEQRLDRCNQCYQELKKVSSSLVTLTRRQGEVGRSAQELSLFLQDIFRLSSI